MTSLSEKKKKETRIKTTIDRAIGILTKLLDPSKRVRDNEGLNAIKLGIEALKRCKTLAENNPLWAAKPLPGETEE